MFQLYQAFASAEETAGSLPDIIAKMGGAICAESEMFTCVTLSVPRDHEKPDSAGKMDIRFAVHFAAGTSKGVLFYAVGGPGGAGVELAESYLTSFDERLLNEMDVVFFDQRGTGQSTAISCPQAFLAYNQAPISLNEPDAAIATAKGFAEDCVAESGQGEILPYLGTAQAVQDVELFRQAIGAPKVWFYGESYGTQFAQTYATRYPDALKGVIIDGVVDLSLDAAGYYRDYGIAVNALLQRIFAACDLDSACSADMGAPAAEIYAGLTKQLAAKPVTVKFTLANGETVNRDYTLPLLEAAAFYSLYGPDSRVAFLRALAAGGRGNLVPLLRQGYDNVGADHETLEPVGSSGWYDAAYFAVTCPDYDDAGHDQAARAKLIVDEAKALAATSGDPTRYYLSERLACVFWPASGDGKRPPAFTGGDYPTLVMNTDADPATPVSNGYAVFDGTKNAYMITMQGGPHVIWGRGLACPDTIVFAMMMDEVMPQQREQVCSQDLLDPYVPITRDAAADAYTLAEAIITELQQSPVLAWWDGGDPLSAGCDLGGTATASAGEAGTIYQLKNCSFWPDVKVSGEVIDAGTSEDGSPDGFTATITIAGAHHGNLTYRRDSTTEASSLTGSYDGKNAGAPR